MYIRVILLLTCEFLFRAYTGCCLVNAQNPGFKGRVEIKSHDLLNNENQSAVAGMLMLYSGWDRSNFDTIYQIYHICGDTLISVIRGIDTSVLHFSMSIGAYEYLLRSEDKRSYIKMPINKNLSKIGSAKANDWQKNRQRKQKSGFQYEYSLRNPDNKVVQLFASVDESVVYQDQLNIGGAFKNAFHYFGKYDTVIVFDGTTETLMKYNYLEDPDYSCRQYMEEYPVKDLTEKEVDEALKLFEGTHKDTIIQSPDRKEFRVSNAIALDKSSPRRPSVGDFQGKYLLVDIWASWCAPCRAEMPFLKELRSRYDEDTLAILSISLDKEQDALKWEAAVASLQMDWVNWIIYEGFQSEFSREYGITAIPRYLIVDPQGKIVNNNAPPPSDEALTLLINELLFSSPKKDD